MIYFKGTALRVIVCVALNIFSSLKGGKDGVVGEGGWRWQLRFSVNFHMIYLLKL